MSCHCVYLDCGCEQYRLLTDQPNLLSEPLQVQFLDISAIKIDLGRNTFRLNFRAKKIVQHEV